MHGKNGKSRREVRPEEIGFLLEKSFMAKQNLNSGGRKQVTWILSEILKVNVYRYE